LLGQVFLPIRELRFVVIGCFCALACLPMVFTFLPPKGYPITWPPYFPPYIQTAAGYAKENELTMSDIPWSMAWYGNVQSLWLTLNAQDLVDITDYQKRVQVLYLSRRMLDRPFYTGWIEENESYWGNVILQAIAGVSQDPTRWPKQVNLALRHQDLPPLLSVDQGRSPPNYPMLPLHYLQAGWPAQLVLTYRDRAPIVQ
jgi:hypothetical protein